MKMLLVEDDVEIAAFLQMELEHEGYEIEVARDGREGLERALATEYGLILLDIMLPGLNGLEVLRRLRTRRTTPVILLTARDTVMDKVTGLDTGANDYVTKPFHIEELLARIRALTRGAQHGGDGSVLKRGCGAGQAETACNAGGARHSPDQDAVRSAGVLPDDLDIVLSVSSCSTPCGGIPLLGTAMLWMYMCGTCVTGWANRRMEG